MKSATETPYPNGKPNKAFSASCRHIIAVPPGATTINATNAMNGGGASVEAESSKQRELGIFYVRVPD